MKSIILALAVLSLICISSAKAEETLDQKADHIAKNENGTLEMITPEEQPEIIKRLKAMQKPAPPQDAIQNNILVALLYLNDASTIASVVDDLHNPKGSFKSFLLLSKWGGAGIIPPLMNDVLHGSTKPTGTKSDPDDAMPSEQQTATMIVFKCVGHSIAFPPATSTWAHNFGTTLVSDKALKHGRETLIDWWTHNETAIKAGHYDQASWLPQ